ncbi:hypothetical protein BX659_13634 [Orenia metallireducens]|uniref:Uncharacterized protein n=1 Tax=Orenia metallireducens TaxID=1413210 RepID=A0A285IFD4_9FIRM|nr:hypothetical protein [Orenia metallireducens]PRX20155.1 hypothetical protein BX659_13634 [Orenia metallireducens]SNY45786.1 hypothetical protein SAMN06265827_13934 [Orenia metallireducens]
MGKEKQIIIRNTPYKKGEIPKHLKQYTDKLAQASRECALSTEELEGMERVQAMNACVSQKMKEEGLKNE